MKFFEYLNKIGFILIIPLTLFLVDFFSLGFLFGYLVSVIIIFFYKNELFHVLDRPFLILLFFSIVYTLFNFLGENKGVQYLIIQVVFPPTFYIVGKLLVHKRLEQQQIVRLMIITAIAYSFTSVSSILLDLGTGGFAQTERTIPSFWNGKGMIATGLAGYIIFNITIPAIIISNKSGFKLFTKIVLIFVFCISMLCTFRLGSRTLIALAAISIVFSILYQLITLDLSGKIKFIIQLTVVILLLVNFAPINLEAEYLSTLGQRLQDPNASSAASAGGRTGLWEEGFNNLFKKPLGWQSSHYAHNLWLDTAKIGSVISLLLLLYFNWMNLSSLRKLMMSNIIILPLKITAALFTLVTLLFFFSEPILEGNFSLFVIFCLFQGMIAMILNNYKSIKKY